MTFGQKRLDAYVYDTEFVKFSMELAQDSIFNMETLLGSLLGERLGRIANRELTIGDGTGDPHGVVTASTLGKTAAAAAAITADELIDLIHSVDPAYRSSPKVRFMFNDTTLAAVRKLKNGTGDYLWQAGDFTNGVAPTLLGYRYSVNQAMASMATGTKPIIFGDFGKYYVRKVGPPTSACCANASGLISALQGSSASTVNWETLPPSGTSSRHKGHGRDLDPAPFRGGKDDEQHQGLFHTGW